MERLFRSKDPWGNGWSLWVIALLLFLIPFIGVGLSGLRLENEVTSWLPEDDPDAAVLNWFQQEFGQDSKLLLSWDSSSVNDPRRHALADSLRHPGNGEWKFVRQGVSEVSTPDDLLHKMLDNRIELPQAVDRLSGVLIGSGYPKVRLTEVGRMFKEQTREQVAAVVSQVLGQDVQVLPPVENEPKLASGGDSPEPAEPSSSSDGADETRPDLQIKIPLHDFQLGWEMFSSQGPQFDLVRQAALKLERDGQPVVEDIFAAAGAPIAIAISLTEFGEDNVEQTLDEIRAVAISAGIPEEEIRMGGSPVGRARLNRSAARAIWNSEYPLWKFYKRSPVILSTIIGVLASFLLLRSFRLAVLVLVTGLYTCGVVLSVMPAAGTTLNMVLIVLPNLLLVLTVSGAIHVANYWRHASRQGHSHPISLAVKMATVPCLLASVTTAIGMASLLTAVLNPVRDFGIYASFGCIISLGMILVGFPAFMSVWPGQDGRSAQGIREGQHWERLATFLVRRNRLVSVACVSLFGLACWGLQWFHTETKVIRYFPQASRIVQDYEFLESGLSGIVPVETVIRFNADVIGHRRIDSENDTVEAEESAARLNILERMEIVRQVEQRIAEHEGISGALSLADFRPSITPPEEGASRLDKIKYLRTAQRTENELFGNRAEEAGEFVTRAIKPVNIELRGRRVEIAEGDEIWRIRAQSIVMSDLNYDSLVADMNRIVREVIGEREGVDYLVTGLVPLFLRTQYAVLESLIDSFALAFVLIAIVMIILLRSVSSGLMAMIPNLFPVGLVFGAVSWAGIPVDIGTMITASVALGIAIDGTLHLLTWFQDGLHRGLTRQESTVNALKHCGPAMWQTSIAIALAMQMLAGADLLLISRFGWLMASLIMAALVGDVILLPALLAGWLGQLIERSTPRASAGNLSGKRGASVTENPTSPGDEQSIKAMECRQQDAVTAPVQSEDPSGGQFPTLKFRSRRVMIHPAHRTV